MLAGTAERAMRELHGRHEHGGRHRHAPDPPPAPAADTPATRARDAPKHAARDSVKRRLISNPEARTAGVARVRKLEDEAYEPRHAAGQRMLDEAAAEPTDASDQGDASDASDASDEHETHDAGHDAEDALAEVDNRTLPKSAQVRDITARQKRRLAMLGSHIVKTAAEYMSVIPSHLANDISGGLLELAAGIVLRREKHRKDGNADRPQD